MTQKPEFSGDIEKDSGMKWVNPLSANHTKWSNTLKPFCGVGALGLTKEEILVRNELAQ